MSEKPEPKDLGEGFPEEVILAMRSGGRVGVDKAKG